jgi:transposase
LQSRRHVNKVIAGKLTRIAWVIISRPGAIYERRDLAIV